MRGSPANANPRRRRPDGIEEKWCNGCGKFVPLDADHFARRIIRRVDGTAIDGWVSYCKPCEAARCVTSDQINDLYPSTLSNPGAPTYEVSACPELLKYFNF